MRKMIVGALAAAGMLGLSACSHADNGAAANTAEVVADNESGTLSNDTLADNSVSAVDSETAGSNGADVAGSPAQNDAANASNAAAPGNAL